MNHTNRVLVLLISACIITLIDPAVTSAQKASSADFIAESLPPLKQLSTEMNQNVLAMLTLVKELDKYGPPPAKSARIIKTVTELKETDNGNSATIEELRLNEEFPVTEERDDWIGVRTPDGRAGWLAREDIQLLVKSIPEAASRIMESKDKEVSRIMSVIAQYYKKINGLYNSATEILKETDEKYNSLSPDLKKEHESQYQSYSGYKDKIEKYYGYAARFAGPYEKLFVETGSGGPVLSAPGARFNGTVSADAGWSSYRNMNSKSSVTQRFMFTGTYQIDKSTTANLAVQHQKELIQTAFANSNIDAGITRRFSDKMTLGANLNYSLYSDKASDKNSFGMLNAGVNGSFSPSDKVNVYGNVSFQSKNFRTPDNNDYRGLLYVLGTNLSPTTKNLISIRLQGITQSGEKDYLTFNQVNPQFLFTHRKSATRLFSAGMDFDMIRFAETSNSNDYMKYKADLKWKNSLKKGMLSQRNINLIYKQYPNNPKQDYYRMGYTMENRKGSLSEGRSSVSSFGYLLNVFARKEDNLLKDYLDIRWDRSGTRPRMYSNMNILTRLWNNIDMTGSDTVAGPDHFIDFYAEAGPSFKGKSGGRFRFDMFRVGLIAGGHIFFNFDADNIMRAGNSIRGGIGANAGIKIFTASLILSGSYERSIVMTNQKTYDPYTGNIVYGDMVYRKPSSMQLNADYRQPIRKNWDIHFNISNYDIRTDATAETSINPVERKSSLRLMGGLLYRFSL